MAELSAFLGRVRSALRPAAAAAGEAEREAAELRVRVRSLRERAMARWPALWDGYGRELEAVGGQGHRAADEAEAAAIIARLARERGATKLVTWDLAAVGFGAVAEHLKAGGLEAVNACPPGAGAADAAARARLRAALAEADLGITGADYAVAETGTLLLISGEGRSRLVSLLPRVHVALIRPSNLVPALRDMAAVLAHEHAAGRGGDASCLTFITGPSRSADIEFVLARGVHGPGEVHVILIA